MEVRRWKTGDGSPNIEDGRRETADEKRKPQCWQPGQMKVDGSAMTLNRPPTGGGFKRHEEGQKTGDGRPQTRSVNLNVGSRVK